jgi:hypothetical protein
MWWVKDNHDHERGGFQNRDVGKTNSGIDFGPEYGIDYARFADPPDITRDLKVKEKIHNRLFTKYAEDFNRIDILVHNGFVILKGKVGDAATRENIAKEVWLITGVKEVINQLKIISN